MYVRENSQIWVCASKIVFPKLQVLLDPDHLPLIQSALPLMPCRRMTQLQKYYLSVHTG